MRDFHLQVYQHQLQPKEILVFNFTFFYFSYKNCNFISKVVKKIQFYSLSKNWSSKHLADLFSSLQLPLQTKQQFDTLYHQNGIKYLSDIRFLLSLTDFCTMVTCKCFTKLWEVLTSGVSFTLALKQDSRDRHLPHTEPQFPRKTGFNYPSKSAFWKYIY